MISNREYNELIQKLAEEIVDSVSTQEEKKEEDAKQKVLELANKKKEEDAKQKVLELANKKKEEEDAKQKVLEFANKKKEEKKAEEYEVYLEEIINKTASVYEEAQFMKQAAYEAMAEAEAQYQAAMEVLAEMETEEEMEVTAGAKDVLSAIKKMPKKYIDTVRGKGVAAAKEVVNRVKNEDTPSNQYLDLALRDLRRARAARGAAIGVPAAALVGGGAYASKRYYDDRKQVKQAAYEAMAEAEAQYQAAMEVLAEAELYEEATYKVAEELELL